ncbi:MAG: DinB family protein [Acidobacteriaceae bacterium]
MTTPYAKYLDGRDPMEVLAETPSAIQAALAGLPLELLDKSPASGKWSIREILCHLADCEIAFGFRWRQGLAEPHHVVQPFDQEAWAQRYAAYDTASALKLFAQLRQWNLKLLSTATPEEQERPVSHPERGQMVFKTLIETAAGHDRNHVLQIESIAQNLASI